MLDLERIDEQRVRKVLVGLFSRLSARKEYQLRHEDYAREMPRSETIRGLARSKEYVAYP